MKHSIEELIFLSHFRVSRPALDESDFLNHGTCVDTAFRADGAKQGSGALQFGPSAVVRVPSSPSWDELKGLVIDIMVRFDGSDFSSRRNLVEGDGCFAFYVAAGGELRFDYFGLVAGQTTPGWHGVSSLSDAVGPGLSLEHGRWVRLRASFDALTTARLWVDGQQVAQKSGFRTGIGSTGGAGVSIGNWTLSDQFPLLGALDWVAVWKLDADAVNHEFVERLDPVATNGWSGFVNCLAEHVNEDDLLALLARYEQLLLAINECITDGDPGARNEIYSLFERYNALWLSNRLDDPDFHSVLANLYALLTSNCASSVADDFQTLVNMFSEIASGLPTDCLEHSGLADADPVFRAGFRNFSQQDFS
jgi:hypothetical protein